MMLSNLQGLVKYYKPKLKELPAASKKEIFDIVFFGSSVKGKLEPRDFDACVIIKHKEAKLKEILDPLRLKQVDLVYVYLDDLYTTPLWLTLLSEGFSLKQNKYLFEIFGFKSKMIFSYDLKALSHTNKTKFSHALWGRRKHKGLIEEIKGEEIGKGCILVPKDKSEDFRKFLELWKVNYNVKEGLIQE